MPFLPITCKMKHKQRRRQKHADTTMSIVSTVLQETEKIWRYLRHIQAHAKTTGTDTKSVTKTLIRNLQDEFCAIPSTDLTAWDGMIRALALTNAILLSSGAVSSWHSHKFNSVGKQNSPLPHSASAVHLGPQYPRAAASLMPHLESVSAISRLVQTGCSSSSNALQ